MQHDWTHVERPGESHTALDGKKILNFCITHQLSLFLAICADIAPKSWGCARERINGLARKKCVNRLLEHFEATIVEDTIHALIARHPTQSLGLHDGFLVASPPPEQMVRQIEKEVLSKHLARLCASCVCLVPGKLVWVAFDCRVFDFEVSEMSQSGQPQHFRMDGQAPRGEKGYGKGFQARKTLHR